MVNTVKLPVPGLNGLAFGGPHHDVIFITASRVLTDKITSQVIGEVTYGSSLYMVTGLGARGNELSRLII